MGVFLDYQRIKMTVLHEVDIEISLSIAPKQIDSTLEGVSVSEWQVMPQLGLCRVVASKGHACKHC